MSRILTATIEDSIDRLEKAGGEAVMKEAIREADRAVDQVKTERETVMARRLQAARQLAMLAKRIDALTEKARFAIDQGRDDLAEAALSQQVDFEAQGASLNDVQALARDEEARLDESLAALKARKSQMEDALSAYVQARREASPHGRTFSSDRSAEKKVDAAEQAFERAMSGAGGGALSRTDAATIHRVAELDVLQKGAVVAERLAALKARQAA